MARDSKTSPSLAPNGAPCRLAKFELRTRAARLTVSGGTISSARFTERGRRAWGAALAGRHGRVSPRRVFCEVRLRGARGARARVDRVGAAPESDERSLRVELPVAVAGWATHALARVRVDARWDTDTRRLHVSVTRQRARATRGTHADAPGASRSVFEARWRCALAGSDSCARGVGAEGTSACSSEPSRFRDAADGARLNAPAATKRVGSRTAACSAYSSPSATSWTPSARRTASGTCPSPARVRARGAPRIVGAPARPRGARVRDRPMVRPHHPTLSSQTRWPACWTSRLPSSRAARANGPRRAAARDRRP